MEAFVWSDRYLTGESQVDAEHKMLVSIINDVISHLSRDTPQAKVESVLDRLVQYAVTHFGHEEALMQRSGCDARFVAVHVGVHQEFAQQVVKLRQGKLAGSDCESLLRFLTSWLAHHILGIDQSMARQIRAIASGTSPQAAYEAELEKIKDPAAASLLDAMNSLYRLVASRNDSLASVNRDLEQQIQARTRAMNAMKDMERFLAQIIDGDPVPTFVIDASHKITHWNQACEKITGHAARDMVGSSNQWASFYPEQRPTMADLIVNGGIESQIDNYYHGSYRRSPVIEGAYESEGYFKALGENGRWLFFTAAPLRNTAGELVGAIETLQDVTERKAAEIALRDQQAHLEREVARQTAELAATNRKLAEDHSRLKEVLETVEHTQQQLLQSEKMAAIGQLAAGVAHEINNPIGFVSSNVSSLKKYIDQLLGVVAAHDAVARGGDPALIAAATQRADLEFLKEDLPSLISETQEGLARVTRIVQDLKDFSHVDESDQQEADLNAGIESTLNVVWNELKYKADVVKELGDLPPVRCVPAQINQVFMNILVNAAQAIESHGRIAIRSGCDAQFVWFEIEDSGQGMPEEVRRRIFEPFYTTKPVGKGTGLGLSISYDIIVKKHHGKLEVFSQPGVGTRFVITLPIRQEG